MSLVYDTDTKQLPPPKHHSVGIDPGVKNLITTIDDDRNTTQIPGFDDAPHRKKTKRLKRKIQRQRDAALKDGRARWVTHKTRDGKSRRRFRWVATPSKQYLKTAVQLRRVEHRRCLSRNGFQHRLTSQLVKDHQVIAIEHTRIHSMTRSAQGTIEEPGKNVRAKSGLNRAILSQGWFGIRQKLEYKAKWYGRQFVTVPAPHTSQTCSACGHTDPANRPSQARFECLNCGLSIHADVNSAENIRRQGLAILARAED